jgi:hypothetical protein
MPRDDWLEPLRLALDVAERPVRFFFRDDDVGWRDDRLWVLLNRFAGLGLPVDLAVIPAALGAGPARLLQRRIDAAGGRLAVHQHGYTHDNHEPEGRKHEFGPSRGAEQQRYDIARGWRLLTDKIGPGIAPIFTPPWNRCTATTGRCVAELGFQVLSRDVTAAPLELDGSGLVELPVTIDWFARRKGVRLDRLQVGALLARAAAGAGPVGVMLHHAVTGEGELDAIGELLELVARHPAATASPMLAAAGIPATATGAGSGGR